MLLGGGAEGVGLVRLFPGERVVAAAVAGGSGGAAEVPVAGGDAEQLTIGPYYDTDLAISPDGNRVAFVSDRDGSEGNVFVLDLGTGALAIVLLLAFFRRLEPDEWLSAMAIGAVLGGAIGNLTDRVVYGEVIDFLDFRLFGGYVWPTFNMADSWIVVGVGILMLEIFLEPDSPPDPEPLNPDSKLDSDLSADVSGPSAP